MNNLNQLKNYILFIKISILSLHSILFLFYFSMNLFIYLFIFCLFNDAFSSSHCIASVHPLSTVTASGAKIMQSLVTECLRFSSWQGLSSLPSDPDWFYVYPAQFPMETRGTFPFTFSII
jgi:hypothetical protein